jgi:glycosyltransferase involved in cell wall biosynthesis
LKRVLYISYDGMTDPLGQSQVINYLLGLSKLGYQFDILSFEKADKYIMLQSEINVLLQQNNIGWYPQVFHTSPPIISKIYDKLNLFYAAKKLHKKNKYDLIHCRSYAAAEAGLKLKRTTGVKFLFDMRGFWADEKADGGAWDKKKWFWNKVYNFYKKKEKEFILETDYIVSLTHAAKKEIESWSYYNKQIPIKVIPCCANSDLFAETSADKKLNARKSLGINKDKFVLSYLGSLGAWYMIDEMLAFFSELKKQQPNAFFLIITNSDHQIITSRLNKYDISIEDVKIITVTFSQVPQNMYATDVSISFIKPVYSKMSSSPVKIGEILSMGIPIIANDIGDARKLLSDNNVGLLVDEFSITSYKNIVTEISTIEKFAPALIRKVAIKNYSLQDGIESYAKLYQAILP